jgi:hypothetical protein
MLALHHQWGILYADPSLKDTPRDWDQIDAFFHASYLAFSMFNRGFFPVIEAWLKTRYQEFTSLMTIFSGHADYRDKQWLLKMGKSGQPTQEFVNKYDGRAMLIMLLCCNPRNRSRITSKKSLVIYNRGDLSLKSMESRQSRQFLHVPGHGDFIGTTDEAQLNEIARQYGYQPTLANIS